MPLNGHFSFRDEVYLAGTVILRRSIIVAEVGMKKKQIFVTCLLILLAAVYLCGFFYFQKHFLPQTTLNGIDVSYKSEIEAAEALDAYDPLIRITERTAENEDFEESISLKSLFDEPLKYPIDELIDAQKPEMWFLSLFQKKEITSLRIENASFRLDKLRQAVKNLYCLKEENILEPQDAYIELSEGSLQIVKENDGCMIREEAVLQTLTDSINAFMKGETDGSVDLRSLYEAAAVKENDPNLILALEEMQKVISKTITIVFKSGSSMTLTNESLWKLLKLEENQLLIDEEALEQFATETAKGNSVSKYEYIDSNSLKNSLQETLLLTEDKTLQVKWVYVTKKLVEVDISEQTLWYYENDVLIFTSPVVTGNASMGCGTPTGTYYVRRKVTDSTLRGSDYTEHVDYWIGWDSTGRIYGFHDASWRDSFGGDIYLTDPSHGCVNMPLDKVAQLYEAVDIGTEVYIHN